MKEQARILVIEDDGDINSLICTILKKQGYEPVPAYSGTEALLRLEMDSFALLILDLMLPGTDGESLLRRLREDAKNEVPVIVLSARASLEDKVQLLTSGADDYMAKPFEPQELLARVYACLRRRGKKTPVSESGFAFKRLRVFPESRRVTANGHEVLLTPHEYAILCILIQAPDKVFSRETLYEKVWKNGYYGEDNTVNVHVSNIRKKLAAADGENEYIKTVWGIGFKMA